MNKEREQDMNSTPQRFAVYSIIASVLTIVIKFGAYFMTGSMGLFSDAVESLINLAAGIMALTVLIIANRPADGSHAYGHGKVEYFSSGAEGLLILVAAVGIVSAAVGRFNSPQELEHLGLGIGLSLGASAINFVTARAMLRGATKHDSITLEADAKHLLTDVWTSTGVALGLSVIIFAPPSWRILDPIIAVAMAMNIMFTGVGLIRRSMSGLMDKALPDEEIAMIRRAIKTHAGDQATFHGLRSRKSGPQRFIDFHLLVPGELNVKQAHDLCCEIEDDIHETLPRVLITIHVEPLEDEASWDGGNVGGLADDEGRDTQKT